MKRIIALFMIVGFTLSTSFAYAKGQQTHPPKNMPVAEQGCNQ